MTDEQQGTNLQSQLLAEARAAEKEWGEAGDAPLVRARPAASETSQVYSVRLPVEGIERFRRLAEERNVKPTALMREWVVDRLAAEELAVRAPEERMVQLLEEAQRLAVEIRRRGGPSASTTPRVHDEVSETQSVRLGAVRRLATPLEMSDVAVTAGAAVPGKPSSRKKGDRP